MIYLSIFWICTIAFYLALAFDHYIGWNWFRNWKEEYAGLYFLLLFGVVIMAIGTNDPITIAGYTAPMEFQWIASLVGVVLTMWKLFLSPMKKDIHRIDKEVTEIKTHLIHIERRLDRLENKVDKILHQLSA